MSSGRHKFKEEFNKSVNVLGKDNYGHYNDSEMNTEESDGKRPYNKSTDVTYEKLTPTVDVTSMYDTINSDDVGNKEQVANMAKQYGYTTDSESDNFKCSTGIETRMKTLAGNQVRNRNTDIAYETLASTNDTSNEYDKIRSGIDDNALERHSSEENTKVYTNMILNATDLNLTESNPDTAKSFEVWTKTESPKALTSEYESLTLQNLSNQDEYNTINGVDRKKIRTAFASRKTRLICIFLVIAILVITTVITTLVFTVFKNENVEKCISLIAPENGFIDDKNKKGSLVVGTEITISCMEGYFVDGNDTVVCYLNRTWSESPACEIRDCGIPSDIKNGYIDDLENTTVNSTFTVKCDEGYIKVGVETVTCDMNGTWRELPNCRPVSCGIPQVLDNETVIVNNVTTFGTTANFRCIEGFSLTSASFATCLSNGSWTQIPSCFKTIGAACEEAEVLYDLVRRSRIYQADGVQGSDPFVDDEYLSPDWYSVIFNGEQYIMPDVNSMPQYNFCGTENPIYLKDPHPEVETLAVTVTVCEKTSSSDCQNMHTIAVRKCGNNNIQYYLSRTSRKSAYCFDPPDINNITEFANSPNAALGSLIVTPELRFSETSGPGTVYQIPFLAFVCVETDGMDRSSLNLIYTTYWYIDDEVAFSFENERGVTTLTEHDLLQKDFGLGIMIRCAVKMASSPAGLKTSIVSSKNFFAGIEVSDNPLYMTRGGNVEISFRPTVPYGCYTALGDQPTGRCYSRASLFETDSQCNWNNQPFNIHYINNLQDQCRFTLEGCYPHELTCTKTIKNATMNITTPFFSNADPKMYKLRLTTLNGGTHSIWKKYKIKDITVLIKDNINYRYSMCYAHVDPHMKTADGRLYELNDYAEEFILYWNTEYNIMVQMKTVSCVNDRAYCTCAVSVRAGGDIFLINLCNGMNFIGMTSCKDNVLNILKYNDLEYQVFTFTGTVIQIHIIQPPNYDMLDIDVKMAPKDFQSISGLCGTFDSNSGNDFHTRNGTVTDRATFINAWRVGQSDKNYLYPTCNPDVSSFEDAEESHACTCNCFDGVNICDTDKSEATCAPSKFLNCTINQKRDNLCARFSNKCVSTN